MLADFFGEIATQVTTGILGQASLGRILQVGASIIGRDCMVSIKAGIVGGTGYTGVELLRLLAQHPMVELSCITSRSESGLPVCDIFPSLRGAVDLSFVDPAHARLNECDVVFFATPNGVAMQQAPALLAAGVRVIDLAADFRLKDVAVWQHWYGMQHAAPEWLEHAVYGLPELNRQQIAGAQLVANPGCYPTAVLLGFAPLLNARSRKEIAVDNFIADAKSGVSGAGRKPERHVLFAEAGDNFMAYGVAGHRHQAEISQMMHDLAGEDFGLVFCPHLAPMIRGIYATLYARIQPGGNKTNWQELYENYYCDTSFVDVLPGGSYPETRSVRGSNCCRISVHQPQKGDMLVVLTVIDNLVKGAAGQAVQNMNLMFALPEDSGLGQLPLAP